ncbi:hypothetical protein, conserved [Leishmania tarentolae]|uniref:Uncharacterized protein n=1 Tax=Leishmania tarentolae TaxID=5689 RepID=A0A640KS12_LEITA|nr:hypothetical protein, conserved [Leishmania tarentolae]
MHTRGFSPAMDYGGYGQVYGGNQGPAGGFVSKMQSFTYQTQQLPSQGYDNYNSYGQYGGYPQQQTNGGVGNANGADQYNGYPQTSGGDSLPALKSSRSFTGPSADMCRKQSGVSRSRSIASRSNKGGSSGMARHGSIFTSTRDRDTQVGISTRGGMSVCGIGQEENEDLKQYYGDMACRGDDRRMDGLKAVRSYRGDIEDGEDVGKPRRVTNRRNVDGRSATGYGGINFKRKAAMRNGEQWGEVEVRSKVKGNADFSHNLPRPPMQQSMPLPNMPMAHAVFDEAPVVPHIYNREDVHSYGDLSDSLSQADEGVAGDFDY